MDKKYVENLKEVCVKLVRILDAYEGGTAIMSNQGQALDGYSALANFISIAKKARCLTASDTKEKANENNTQA